MCFTYCKSLHFSGLESFRLFTVLHIVHGLARILRATVENLAEGASALHNAVCVSWALHNAAAGRVAGGFAKGWRSGGSQWLYAGSPDAATKPPFFSRSAFFSAQSEETANTNRGPRITKNRRTLDTTDAHRPEALHCFRCLTQIGARRRFQPTSTRRQECQLQSI